VADVTQTTVPEALPTRPRLRWDAIALLVLAAASAGLLIAISYGFNTEYADTAASDISVAARSFVDWGIGLVVVIAFALGALAVARRSRGGRTMSLIATAVAVVTVIGVPAGAVLGMHEKFERYPDQPSCTSGFTGGPAVRVVRASQREFVELDHPGPFSGGGASGVDGCATQLMVDGDVDVPGAYRPTLAENGWRIDRDERSLVSATKGDQEFQAYREGGSWWVWIGPTGVGPPTRPEQGVNDGAPEDG
jgi:hypothetical protein